MDSDNILRNSFTIGIGVTLGNQLARVIGDVVTVIIQHFIDSANTYYNVFTK